MAVIVLFCSYRPISPPYLVVQSENDVVHILQNTDSSEVHLLASTPRGPDEDRGILRATGTQIGR